MSYPHITHKDLILFILFMKNNAYIKRCHLAGEQALHLGESREFTREPETRRETRARGMSSFTACFARHLPVQTEWKKWCSTWSLGRLGSLRKWSLHFWTQLFEGRLALNPGLNNPGLFFLCSKAFSRIIFSVIFRTSNHQLVDKKN